MNIFTFFTQFRSYSNNIRFILIWNMIFCLGLGIHLILYNIYIQSIVQDEAIIGKIIGLNFLAQALIYLPAGIFSDRVGSKKGVMVGVFIFIVALIGNLSSSNPSELSFWAFLVGIGHAASIVTFVPLLSEYSTAIEKKDLFTFAFSTGTLFTFLGTLSGGIVSDGIREVFQFSQTSSIRITLLFSILLFIGCIGPLLFIKEKSPSFKTEKKREPLLSLIKEEPKSIVPIAKFSFSKVLSGVSLGIIGPFINLYFLQKFSLSASSISLVLAGGTLITVIFMTYNPKISQRLTEARTVSLYHILSIPAALLLGFTQSIWIAIVAFIVFRSVNFGINPIESKIVMDQVTPEIRGIANSFGFMANSLCISILGPFSMYIIQAEGSEQGYLVLCVVSAIASLIASLYFSLAFGQRKKLSQRVGSVHI